MQDEWARWTAGLERVRDAARPTPTAVEMLSVVLVAVADMVGRAGLSPHGRNALLERVRNALDGRG